MNNVSKYTRLVHAGSNILINRKLVKVLGLLETTLLSELTSEENYYYENNKLTYDGFFYSTVENIEDILGLNWHKQRQLFLSLEEFGVIELDYRGMPPKRYIRITDKLFDYI